MKNEALITHMMETGLSTLFSHYTFEELLSNEDKKLQINGMNLFIHQYQMQGFGNLLIMETTNSPALQLLTFVITPFYKALPLFSFDAMLMNTNRTFLLEYYDLVKEKDTLYSSYLEQFKHLLTHYDDLTDLAAKPCWYDSLKTVSIMKSGDTSNDEVLTHLFLENLSKYIEMEAALPVLSKEEQKIKWTLTTEYADRLVKEGGTSTDLFKAALGPDQTKEFFHSVFFGTDLYAPIAN